MTNRTQDTILENGSRNLITKHVLWSNTGTAADNEGTFNTPVSKILTPFGITLTAHAKVQRIIYSITKNCMVITEWIATTNVLMTSLCGWGVIDLRDNQGMINDAGTGVTGDIGFFAQFPTAADATFPPDGGYTIILDINKGT